MELAHLAPDHLQLPGKDYIIDPSSLGIKGTFPVKVINHSPTYYASENFHNVILLIDTSGNGKLFTTDSVRLWKNKCAFPFSQDDRNVPL